MTVHLVGAGPGDPDLLTIRAARLLAEADVVVHDRLVGSAVLALAPDAILVDVGKRPGSHRRTQDEINAELVALGARYPTVVRLKGGDPYVFGRGGEEASHLRAAGIDVDVVPGVSSALAAPAAAGVPVTHRGHSTGVTVVTAATAADTEPPDWSTLARLDHTLVVLMGVRAAPEIAASLLAAGCPADRPVAIVGSATTDRSRTVRTTLAELGTATVPAPATIVIGDVAALDDLPTWRPTPISTWGPPTTAQPSSTAQPTPIPTTAQPGPTPNPIPTVARGGAA